MAGKVTQFSSFLAEQSSPGITLDTALASIKEWRKHKKNRSEKIPNNIWDMIFKLIESMPTSKVLGALTITRDQFESKCIERNISEYITNTALSEPIEQYTPLADFCEAEPEYPISHKPAKAFATNTSIVELYRPDGMLMKIHICTDSFEELLRAFFKG